MATLFHLCASFDPSGDVVRCVSELNKHSRHRHILSVHKRHPLQGVMRLPEPERYEEGFPFEAVRAADAIVCHFVGWPGDWAAPSVPMAFRNINIRYDGEKFFSEEQFNAARLDIFKLTSSSHAGASEFLPGDNFRWLPDLVDAYSEELTPDFSERPQCLSYIKHSRWLDGADFGASKMGLNRRPHGEVLSRRKREATIVFDNACDGHWGLSGNEALALGFPVAVFNHERTLAALKEYCHDWLPFELLPSWVPDDDSGTQIPGLLNIVERLAALGAAEFLALREKIRRWFLVYFSSPRLIYRFWEPFFEELLA